MATYNTALSQTYSKRLAPTTGHRTEVVATAIIAVTTAMIDNTNDVINLFYVPKGAVITGITLSATDMDTNGAPTLAFDIGDAGSANRLMAASVVGKAGTLDTALARTGHLYKYTADTLIKAGVQAAAATGADGTLMVSLRYFVDPEFSTTALVAT